MEDLHQLLIQEGNPADGSKQTYIIDTSSGSTHVVLLDDPDVRRFMDAGGTQYESVLYDVISTFTPYYPVTQTLQQFNSGKHSNSYYQKFIPDNQNLNKYMNTVDKLLFKHSVHRAHNGFARKTGKMTKSTPDLAVHRKLLNRTITYDNQNGINPLRSSDFKKYAVTQQKLIDIAVPLIELIKNDTTK